MPNPAPGDDSIARALAHIVWEKGMANAVTDSSAVIRPGKNRIIGLLQALCFFVFGIAVLPSLAASYNANLSATPNPNSGDYTLTWTSGQAGMYRVQERLAGTSAWTLIHTTNHDTTSYNVVNQPNGIYEYSIWRRYTICTGGGRGGCTTYIETSEVISVTVQDPAPSVPDAPITNLISLDGAYPISWNAVAGATSYKLDERSNGGVWSEIYSGSPTSHSVAGRPTSTREYRVKACNSSACSGPSSSSTTKVEIVTTLNSETPISTATVYGDVPFTASVDRRGDATVIVPIRVPDGVNGLEPRLAFSYSSGGAPLLEETKRSEGVLGYGWRLAGPPELRRCRTGIGGDIQHDTTDRLCLNGSALVEVTSAAYWADNAEYRTEIDTATKVTTHGVGLGNRYFTAHLPDGTKLVFGDTADTRVTAPGYSSPYLWSPRLRTDAFGNQMTYDWKKVSAIGTNFLRNINYGNASVEFRYHERCYDQNNCDSETVQNGGNVAGVKGRAVVLNRILSKVNSNIVSDVVLDNDYVNGYLRLERLQVCGYTEAGALGGCMAPLDFTWQTLQIATQGILGTKDQLVVNGVINSFGDRTDFSYAVIDGNGAGNHALHVARHAEFPDKPLPGNVGTSNRQRALVSTLR